MLTSLHIKNFKAWQDTQKIRLAPLTVFFGSNSAGKTSLLQFLLMLKQTAESPDRARVMHPGDVYTYVELGTFKDIAYNHEVTREIDFSLEWQVSSALMFTDPLSQERYGGSNIRFSATIANDSKNTQSVRSLEYEVDGQDDLNGFSLRMAQSSPKRFGIKSPQISLKRFQGRAWGLPSPVRFYGFPDEVSAYYQNAGFVSQLALELERQLRKIHYLGPLREDPLRTYTWSGEFPEHVGVRGDRAIEAILAATDRYISPQKYRKAVKFPEVISKWLRNLELLQSFEAKPIASGRKEYEVEVKATGSKLEVLLPDVGFGISQVLPVIVECFYAPPESTIIMEQPELHLHPRVQSHLADLFIETVQARENNADRNIQLIIESHSEHFLRRLQRRVAEGTIDADQVALYFCEPTEAGSKLTELTVNHFGDIENWPNDFFGDEMEDLAKRLDAASRREAETR